MLSIKLAQQVGVIFFLMAVGVFAKKKGIVTIEGARMFSNLTLVVITPALLVQVFQRKLERQLLVAMGAALLFAVLFHLLAIAVTHFCYPDGTDEKQTVERILAISSNCGYVGIPLISAVMGDSGLLYAAIYIAVFNIYIWTHTVSMLRHTRPKLREVLLSPGTIGVTIGAVLFFLQLSLPVVLRDGIGYVASMNTPLPMILTGVFVADVSLKKAFQNPRVYITCAMRLVVLPLVMLGILWIIRASHWFVGADAVALAAMISCCCPGGIITIMMPARFGGGDPEYGATLVAASTLFAILSVPFIVTLSQFVLSF